MALFGLFGGRKKGYQSSWLHLTVLYATACEGLEPDQTFALRGKILAANPIDFEFVNSDSFLVFYAGSATGLDAATRLAETLQAVAREKAVPAFGVAIQQGECLAQMTGAGRLKSKPMGGLMSRTKELAIAASQPQRPDSAGASQPHQSH